MPGRDGKRGQDSTSGRSSHPTWARETQRGGQGRRGKSERKRKGPSQGPLHTRGHRGWGWRNGCPFLNLFSETQPFTPEEGIQGPSSQQGQRHPAECGLPSRSPFSRALHPERNLMSKGLSSKERDFKPQSLIAHIAPPIQSSFPAPKPTRPQHCLGQLGCLLPDMAAVVSELISKHKFTFTLLLKPMGSASGVKVTDTARRTTGLELNETAERTMRSDRRLRYQCLAHSFLQWILSSNSHGPLLF